MIDWQDFTLSWSGGGGSVDIRRHGVPWARLSVGDARPSAEPQIDADEARQYLRVGGADVEVRSSFAATWDLRWTVSPLTSAEIPELRWDVSCAPGFAAWVWPAGAQGVLAIGPVDRAGPVLAFVLGRGFLGFCPGGEPALPGLGEAGGVPGVTFVPPGLRLEAGRRWVTTLRASVHAQIDKVADLLPEWLVPLHAADGEVVELRLPDAGLVGSGGVVVRTDADVSLVSGSPGRGRVEVREPRGTTVLELTWAASLEAALRSTCAEVVRGRPSGAGALVVSEALSARVCGDPEAAEAYLDGFEDDPEAPAFAAAALAAEAVRTSRTSRLDRAQRVLAACVPDVGYGRAAMRTWLAGIQAGRAPDDRLAELFSRTGRTPRAQLELSLVGYRSADSAIPALAGIVTELGGALPGRPLSMGDVEAASLVGLLDLTPDEWPVAARAGSCANKTRRRLLSAVAAGEAPVDVLAWLLLGVR